MNRDDLILIKVYTRKYSSYVHIHIPTKVIYIYIRHEAKLYNDEVEADMYALPASDPVHS